MAYGVTGKAESSKEAALWIRRSFSIKKGRSAVLNGPGDQDSGSRKTWPCCLLW